MLDIKESSGFDFSFYPEKDLWQKKIFFIFPLLFDFSTFLVFYIAKILEILEKKLAKKAKSKKKSQKKNKTTFFPRIPSLACASLNVECAST